VKIRNIIMKKFMYCLKMIKCDYSIAIIQNQRITETKNLAKHVFIYSCYYEVIV